MPTEVVTKGFAVITKPKHGVYYDIEKARKKALGFLNHDQNIDQVFIYQLIESHYKDTVVTIKEAKVEDIEKRPPSIGEIGDMEEEDEDEQERERQENLEIRVEAAAQQARNARNLPPMRPWPDLRHRGDPMPVQQPGAQVEWRELDRDPGAQ